MCSMLLSYEMKEAQPLTTVKLVGRLTGPLPWWLLVMATFDLVSRARVWCLVTFTEALWAQYLRHWSHPSCHLNVLILPGVAFGGLQVHRYCSGPGLFAENCFSCFQTHCGPLTHLQRKTGSILCCCLSTFVLHYWLFEGSTLPLPIYSSTLSQSEGGFSFFKTLTSMYFMLSPS